MPKYEYRAEGLRVRITHPAPEGGIGVRIEHDSGAALIVASCPAHVTQDGLTASVRGFDGNLFDVRVSKAWEQVDLAAEQPTPILGGGRAVRLNRRTDLEREPTSVRVSGDEATMPIPVDET